MAGEGVWGKIDQGPDVGRVEEGMRIGGEGQFEGG
jgi:hypothetical protein